MVRSSLAITRTSVRYCAPPHRCYNVADFEGYLRRVEDAMKGQRTDVIWAPRTNILRDGGWESAPPFTAVGVAVEIFEVINEYGNFGVEVVWEGNPGFAQCAMSPYWSDAAQIIRWQVYPSRTRRMRVLG